MRHFRSILYAFVLAPAVWVLVGVGLTQNLTARGRDGFAVESLTGLLLLVLGGAAYGILIFAPISPAGPFLAGLGFLAVGVWAIEAPSAYAGVWPAGVTKPGFDLSRPGYGLAALLAVPLIATALSARRWARYEPPVLPIIGQIGRARGAAPAPGMPIAVAETTVISGRPFIGGFATETERTTVLRVPAQTANTTAVVVTAPEEPTAVVVTQAEEPTAVVVAAAEEEPTAVVVAAAEEKLMPVVVTPAEEELTAVVVTPAEEVLTAVGVASGDEEPTVAVVEEPDEEKTVAVVAGPVEEKPTEHVVQGQGAGETTAAVIEEGAEDETTKDVVAEELTEEQGADVVAEEPTEAVLEEPAEPAETPVEDESPEEATAAAGEAAPEDEDETTVAVEAAGEDETEAIESPADETTSVVAPVNGAGPAPAEKATPGDDERTQVLRLPARPAEPDDAAEKTQAIRLPVGAEATQLLTAPAPDSGEKTQVLRTPVPRTAGGDETQVIRMPGAPADSERTQVIRPGLVTPPPSIAGAERPNFAEDPTGRLVPPAPASEEPTRTMTVMNLERPPDEIPTQRRPTQDED